MRKLLLLITLFVGSVFANDISWKTLDVKFGPYLASYSRDYHASGVGLALQAVKPFSPYVGMGLFYEVGRLITMATDCGAYNLTDFDGGLLLNMNVPISRYFSLASNFMFGLTYRYGEIEENSGGMDGTVVIQDKNGNQVEGYLVREWGVEDYETESFQFRSNLGFSVHSKSQKYGAEFYFLDIAVDQIVRQSFSINGVFRIF